MITVFKRAGFALVSLALATVPYTSVLAADERQSMEELRNTVINLLQTLVDQGVISREKAAQMVKAAQDKAAADAAAVAKTDQGAVRVPYVPQIVKDDISKQVAESVTPVVVAAVEQDAKTQRWGVPGALPEWLTRTKISGALNLREEAVLYPGGNVQGFYFDFYKINQAGGISKAGLGAYLDVDENRIRTRGAARLAIENEITSSLTAGLRLSTGNSTDLVSPTQTIDGTNPYNFGVDNLYIRLDERTASRFNWLTVIGGKFNSPWLAPTDLIFHKQLTFNGVAATGRLGIGDGSADQSNLFMTLAAMPIQEVQLSSRDKWLYGAQLGVNLRFVNDQRLRFGVAYYDFANYEGRENPPFSTIYDYTAPQFMRNGNSKFDIRNDNDSTTNLFAVSSKFRLVDVGATYDLAIGRYDLRVNADAVKNVGFKEAEILARTGQDIAPRVKGYQADIGFGDPDVLSAGAWRALIGYRYLQRDAVIDAYTDSDFHYGGTDASGYYLTGDYGLAKRLWMRFRYMSSNAIDGPTYAVDTLQIDINTAF